MDTKYISYHSDEYSYGLRLKPVILLLVAGSRSIITGFPGMKPVIILLDPASRSTLTGFQQKIPIHAPCKP